MFKHHHISCIHKLDLEIWHNPLYFQASKRDRPFTGRQSSVAAVQGFPKRRRALGPLGPPRLAPRRPHDLPLVPSSPSPPPLPGPPEAAGGEGGEPARPWGPSSRLYFSLRASAPTRPGRPWRGPRRRRHSHLLRGRGRRSRPRAAPAAPARTGDTPRRQLRAGYSRAEPPRRLQGNRTRRPRGIERLPERPPRRSPSRVSCLGGSASRQARNVIGTFSSENLLRGPEGAQGTF